MAKGRKARADGTKKAPDPRPRDLETRRAPSIAGGASSEGIHINDILVSKVTDCGLRNR